MASNKQHMGAGEQVATRDKGERHGGQDIGNSASQVGTQEATKAEGQR
jgi:hypothetical protein